MKIYQDIGYIDIRAILNQNLTFNFIVGGRATGKTYTALKTAVEDERKFIYMRRTQTQADLINRTDFSPFKSINTDTGWKIGSEVITKYNAGFYQQKDDGDKLVCFGKPIGYTCALSTISNMRGFDASDVDLLIYDEFIPEKHERPIKNEGAAFLNAYETINRNRELKGIKPLQVICLANANDLANPLFMELKLIRKTEQMRRKKQEVYIDKERSIGVFILDKSPISQQKKETALYRLTAGSTFEKMSIGNEFAGEEVGRIKSRPINEYKPVVSIGEITVYEHKSKREFYVSTHKVGSPPTFGLGDTEKARFRRLYCWIWEEYMDNNIEFEEYLCEIILTKLYN